MNWEAVGAIGEIVGAAAVFVGYQCAFFQLRQEVLGEDDWKIFRALLRSFWLLPGKELARM